MPLEISVINNKPFSQRKVDPLTLKYPWCFYFWPTPFILCNVFVWKKNNKKKNTKGKNNLERKFQILDQSHQINNGGTKWIINFSCLNHRERKELAKRETVVNVKKQNELTLRHAYI